MGQAMLLQNELAQALGFIQVVLAQLVGKETPLGFFFQRATQGDSLIA
jgi:hypothetical protein